jgi:hypothetical protein
VGGHQRIVRHPAWPRFSRQMRLIIAAHNELELQELALVVSTLHVITSFHPSHFYRF